MALLNILQYPDKRLRRIAKPVAAIDESVKTLVNDMFETMYEATGSGLAATQVNVLLRVVVMDISDQSKEPLVLINPEVTHAEGKVSGSEGCLSVPGIFENVERASNIVVKTLDLDGNQTEFEADGLLARCVQHEIDHLDGKLFIDHLSSLKRKLISTRLLKNRRRRL